MNHLYDIIIMKFALGIIAFYVTPFLYLYYKYKDKFPLSLIIFMCIAVSYSCTWFLAMITSLFNLPHYVIYYVVLFLSFFAVFILWKIKNFQITIPLVFLLSIIILLPLFLKQDIIFVDWDAVVSWNRWAVELSDGKYYMYKSLPYPILLPAIWSLFYKIQGTNEIWFTVKFTIVFINLFVVMTLIQLFKEMKSSIFIIILILLYPLLILRFSTSGYVDYPLMFFGILSVLSVLLSELNKENEKFDYYLSVSIILSGLASIIKFNGLIFIVFTFVYTILNLKNIKKGKLILTSIIFSILLPLSYILFFIYHGGEITLKGINDLQKISVSTLENNNIFYKILTITIRFFAAYKFYKIYFISFLISLILFFYSYKRIKNINYFSCLLLVFIIIGYIIYFNTSYYDSRNALPLHSFIIIFMSIIFGYFIDKKYRINHVKLLFELNKKEINFNIRKKIITNIYVIILLFLISYFMNNDTLYKIQRYYQSKIGEVDVAIYIKKIYEYYKPCFIVTNLALVRYNYYVKDIRELILNYGGLTPPDKYLNLNCNSKVFYITYKIGDVPYLPDDIEKFNLLIQKKIINEYKQNDIPYNVYYK